jgi:hypothetical protein
MSRGGPRVNALFWLGVAMKVGQAGMTDGSVLFRPLVAGRTILSEMEMCTVGYCSSVRMYGSRAMDGGRGLRDETERGELRETRLLGRATRRNLMLDNQFFIKVILSIGLSRSTM